MWAYGNVPTGWKICKVKDYSTVVTDYVANGSFASLAKNVSYKDTEDEAILIRLTDFNNGFNGNFVYIDNHAYEFLSKSKLFGGEIIISNVGANVGTVFKCPYLDKKMSLAPNSIMLKTLGNDDFYYYWFSSRNGQHSLKSIVTGSAQPKFNKTNFRDLEIPVPPIETQNRIVSILKSIDSKIELNNKINNNLEQQAQTLFNEWFVKFSCFDEEFISSPIGTSIPKSLNMVQIGDLDHILETGKRPKGGAVQSGIPSIGAESVKKLGDFSLASTKYIPVEYAQKLAKGKINGYELLLYKDGGKPGTFTPHFSMFGEGYPFDEFYINEHVFKLDFHNRGFNEFMYFYMKTDYPYHWLANNGGKAAIPGINQSDVNTIWTYNPKHLKVVEYCDWVQPIFTKILQNLKQNMQLAALRDSLLPKLMSGELDVSELDIY